VISIDASVADASRTAVHKVPASGGGTGRITRFVCLPLAQGADRAADGV
jgi:hypothetical protein